MNPQYRKPVILFLASFLPIAAGMALKVSHWPGALTIFGAGMLVQMFSILWLMREVMRKGKK